MLPTYCISVFARQAATSLLLLAVAISLLSYWGPARADAPGCPSPLAKSAEADVVKVVDWGSLYKAFRRYKSCDDGAIGEGFSDRVTALLSAKWDTLPQLGQIIAKDRGFAAFLIRHIDETTDPVNLQRIMSNAQEHGCPGLDKATCSKLSSQAEAALKALRAVQTR